MNWATTMPYYYSEYRSGNSGRNVNLTPLSTAKDDTSKDGSNKNVNSDAPHAPQPQNMTDFLEPAMDGPPSPERIRQLSNQMKRATHLNRAYGHRAASSSSSSLLVSERAGWEQALDNAALSRRSSNRSTTSASPSRDRPDSVQVLGKNIFHRRARSSKSNRVKRESSANSSSGSSLYSADLPSEPSLSNLKEAFMPTIFARRKSSRDETALQRKLQISGPYNFQHVTHTPRDQIANLQHVNRRELVEEFSTMRVGPSNSTGEVTDSENSNAHFSKPSPDHVGDDTSTLQHPHTLRQTAPTSGPRRLVKHVRSQEQLRSSPTRPVRPPRSPIEEIASPTLPPVPPRVSSRQSNRYGSPTSEFDRPQTSGGFYRPQPFNPEDYHDDSLVAPDEIAPDAHFPAVDESRFSHAITTPDNAAWPLAAPGTVAYEPPLADVPEEEENLTFTRRSRASLASNSSSLRASQSVPALRTLSQQNGRGIHVSPIHESWEDDIDYCYEHEADANFDYEWERPSLDVGREGIATAPPVHVAVFDDELSEAPTAGIARSSPGMLSASRFDVPALSPASQASPQIGYEATTPLSATAVKNNFSLPRTERLNRPPSLMPSHARCDSRASSFKESHGFTLSPSLLIPNDYHHQMLLSENDKQEYSPEEEFRTKFFKSNAFYEDNLAATNHTATLAQQQRASVSTTTTNSTTVSDSTGERHVSANSTWTTLTRLTSSTSLNKMTEPWSDVSGERVPSTHLADPQDESDHEEEEAVPPAPMDGDTVPELTPIPSAQIGMRSHHKSHASESIVRDDVLPLKSPDLMKPRRQRARTASLSQAPPVGQYALFPRSYVKTTGDRI
ncbi:hypothetical protein BGZ63DRAFT_467113 [Mariannaea sp. PMI_226]|nr:hypothetical protein BGZ63DRAFT_467113 [Mariannaea sp. PMI_226]